MKQHPIHRFDLNAAQRDKDYLRGLKKDVEQDDLDRYTWLEEKARSQRWRYGLEMRNPTYPWPGSSDIVLPLSDKFIDQLKPEFVSLVSGARPPVSALAVNSRAVKNRGNVELFFEWLIKWGSPRFIHEIVLASDDLLELGRGVIKTYWAWETLHSPETLMKERLPDRLAGLVVDKVTPEVADILHMLRSRVGVGGAVLTPLEFDVKRAEIQRVVELEFNLDPKEKDDQEAIRKILSWLRAGAKDPLTITKRDVRWNVPAVRAVSPIDLIVPETTFDLQDSERITHQMFYTHGQLLRRARDAGWNLDAVEEMLKRRSKRAKGDRDTTSPTAGPSRLPINEYHQQEAAREGMDTMESGIFEVWEVCSYYAERQGVPDQKIVTILSPDYCDIPFKSIRYSRPSGRWPYHETALELNKRRWYSPRGIPELLRDLEQEITWEHRSKLNRMSIANAPTFKYRPNSNFNPSNVQWIPGQMYPVNKMDDFEVVQIPNIDISFEREEQNLRTWAEERVGGTDFGLSNPLSSMSEPRTATEIRGIQQRAARALSLRGTLFQAMMQEVYTECFDLWHAFGPQEVWVRLTQGEPIKLTKEELQGQFVFQVTGTIGQTDPVLDAQKALTRVQVLMSLAQTGALGPEYELNLGVAIKDWLEKDDIRMSKIVLRERSPQEVQAIKAQAAQRQAAVDKALTNVPATPQELEIAANELQKKLPHGKAQQVRLGGR